MKDRLDRDESDSLGEVLRGLRALFPTGLLAGEGWERLVERADEFPAGAISCFYPEFRLDDLAPSADFFLSIGPSSPEAKYFIDRGAEATPGSAAAGVAWYLAEIARPESALLRWSNAAWVGYDLVETPSAPGADPGFYIRTRHLLQNDADTAGEDPQRTARSETAAVLARTVGWPGDADEQRAVERAFDALPPGGRMTWAGAMPGRRRSIRLVAAGIAAEEAPGFLERLEWPGPMRTALDALQAVEGFFCDTSLVSFNVNADGPLTNLGLELHAGAERHWLKTGTDECRPLLDRLVETGWCLPAKWRALTGWLGRERFFTESGATLVWKGLNHAKVTIREGGVGAKAYVGVAIAPLGSDPPDAPPAEGAGDQEEARASAGAAAGAGADEVVDGGADP